MFYYDVVERLPTVTYGRSSTTSNNGDLQVLMTNYKQKKTVSLFISFLTFVCATSAYCLARVIFMYIYTRVSEFSRHFSIRRTRRSHYIQLYINSSPYIIYFKKNMVKERTFFEFFTEPCTFNDNFFFPAGVQVSGVYFGVRSIGGLCVAQHVRSTVQVSTNTIRNTKR